MGSFKSRGTHLESGTRTEGIGDVCGLKVDEACREGRRWRTMVVERRRAHQGIL